MTNCIACLIVMSVTVLAALVDNNNNGKETI